MRADSIYSLGDSAYEFTKRCTHCKEITLFALTKDEYERLFIKNEFIHVVFPHLTAEEREVMISGTHPKCWDEMFGDWDEDYDEDEE